MTLALLALLALGPGDGWFGVDKVKHFVVSAVAQSMTHAVLQYAGARHSAALAGSLAVGAALGVARERHDARVKGRFSRRDLAWDAAGLAGTSLLLWHTEP